MLWATHCFIGGRMPEVPTNSARSPASMCMHCGYDLRAAPSGRCPECGRTFDAAKLRRRIWRRRWIALAVMAIILYAPFSWLFFVNDDPAYVRDWIRLWGILPGLVPTHMMAATIVRK